MEITFDQYSKSINRLEGAVDLAEAYQIVSEYIAGQKESYESEDDPFAISIFAFQRDNNNFLEIAIDSKTLFRVRLQCRCTKKIWKLSWRSTYDKDLHVPSAEEIRSIVRKFFQEEMEAFRLYFDDLPYKESKYYAIGAA